MNFRIPGFYDTGLRPFNCILEFGYRVTKGSVVPEMKSVVTNRGDGSEKMMRAQKRHVYFL